MDRTQQEILANLIEPVNVRDLHRLQLQMDELNARVIFMEQGCKRQILDFAEAATNGYITTLENKFERRLSILETDNANLKNALARREYNR